MPVINWILIQQVQLGMILCACLFVPWGQRRSCFVPRLAAGVWGFLALTDTLTFLPQWAKLLLYTTLLFGLIWFSFDCSPLHALFYTTCAYAVQHIASKLAYMPIIWLIQHGRTDRRVTFVILLFSNLVVCLVIYLLFTLRIRRGRLGCRLRRFPAGTQQRQTKRQHQNGNALFQNRSPLFCAFNA